MRRPTRSRLFGCLTVLAVLALGEGGARVLAPRLPSSGEWPDGPIAQQYDGLAHGSATAPVPVVFVGSSMVEAGIDPSTFSSDTGLRALNAAVPASTNAMLTPWLSHVVVPLARPRVVLIGIATRDFNDNAIGPHDAILALTRSPGYHSLVARDALTRFDRFVSRYSALIRLRRQLRNPMNILRAIVRADPSLSRDSCRSSVSQRYRSSALVSSYPSSVLKNYSAGGAQTTALIQTIDHLKRMKIGVVLVKLPTTTAYLALHPHGRPDIASFDRAVRNVVRQTRAPLIDASEITSTHYFQDQIHMNCAGAKKLTSAIARDWPTAALKRFLR